MKELAILAIAALAFGCAGPQQEKDLTQSQPDCAEVWAVGKTLPKGYEGCVNGDVLVASVERSDGTVVYDDRLEAKPGQPIRKVE